MIRLFYRIAGNEQAAAENSELIINTKSGLPMNRQPALILTNNLFVFIIYK